MACPQACRPRCRRFPCPSRRPRPPPGGSRSSSSSRRGPGGNWRTSGTTSKPWSRWAGPGGTFHQQALAERLLYTSAEVRGRSRRMRAALRLSARCEASLPGPRVHSEEEPILLFSPLKNRPGPTPSQARCRPWGPREHSSRGRGVRGPHAPGARRSAENRGRVEGGRRRSGRPQPRRAMVRPGDKSHEARGRCHSEDLAVSRLVAEKHRAGS